MASAVGTVREVLLEGIALFVVVLFLYEGDLRSSILVSANLLLTPLATLLVMNYMGLSADLMSLGGLAIDMPLPGWAQMPDDS